MSIFSFCREIINRVIKNDLMSMANALTLRLILAIFPFIIFLMCVFAYLNLDFAGLFFSLIAEAPTAVQEMINGFITEATVTKSISILSSSLLLTLFSASAGFHSLIVGLNRAYDITDKRNFIYTRLISLLLVIVFTVLIVLSLYLFIFAGLIEEFLLNHTTLNEIPSGINSLGDYIIYCIALFVIMLVIYKISVYKRVSILSLIPGTAFTIISWLLLSKAFSFYINNFSRYSRIYGSIGSLFVFSLWLNLLAIIILVGGQINAVIDSKMEG